MKKYIVYSGEVVSRTDGDLSFISAAQLMQLHQVNPSECIIIGSEKDRQRLRGLNTSKMIILFPRADGKYKLYNKPLETNRQKNVPGYLGR